MITLYVNCDLIATSPVLGHEKRGKDKGNKNVLVMSSKAKGKDRLTGRARRSVTAKHDLVWHSTKKTHRLILNLIQPSKCLLHHSLNELLREKVTMANEICGLVVNALCFPCTGP